MRAGAPILSALATVAAVPAAAADYVMIRNDIVVAAPVDRVWSRVGGYCAIAAWLKVTCEMVAGDGDVGSVRRLNGTTLEPMVARTPHSYTYWQSQGAMGAAQFHGTLLAEPIDGGRTRLSYTLRVRAAAAEHALRGAARRDEADRGSTMTLQEPHSCAG